MLIELLETFVLLSCISGKDTLSTNIKHEHISDEFVLKGNLILFRIHYIIMDDIESTCTLFLFQFVDLSVCEITYTKHFTSSNL